MNKQSKRTLRAGIVLLTLLTAVLVTYLNWAYAKSHSNRAQITISTYQVGTNYAGLVTRQYVTEGDIVRQGQPLFKLKSDELTKQIKGGQVTAQSLIYPLGDDGQLTILAGKAGKVGRIDATQGSFVGADKPIATISDTSTLGVTADFTLNKSELANLTATTPLIVTLGAHQKVGARITSIVQSAQDGRQITTVQAKVDPDMIDSIASIGTQVDATLVLDQATLYNRLLGYTQRLLGRWL